MVMSKCYAQLQADNVNRILRTTEKNDAKKVLTAGSCRSLFQSIVFCHAIPSVPIPSAVSLDCVTKHGLNK